MSNDRRDFFKKVAGAAATLAAVDAVGGPRGAAPTPEAAVGAGQRGFVGGRVALELEGAIAGFIHSTEGGDATADVVEEADESCAPRKHLGNVRYEEIQISCGTGMSAAFYQWLQSVPSCDFTRKSGAILAADFNFKEIARLAFTNALITEFGMPALDAASKDPALMTVRFAPDSTQRQKGSGQTITPCGTVKQKKWLASNFRLTIDGLDCKKVNAVDAITIKQAAPQRERGRLEIPNLVVTLAESGAQSFFDWHQDFVINGNNGSENEKNGMLEYLTPNLAETLFTITFQHLGIFKLAPEKVEAGSENIRRIKAEMYCQQMAFKFGPGAAGC